MRSILKLEDLFKESISRLNINQSKGAELWRDIEKQYARSSRQYHNLSHLNHLANVLWDVRKSVIDWDVLVLAIAYHDVVYNTRKSDNEEKSAEYADKVLSEVLPEEKKSCCRSLS